METPPLWAGKRAAAKANVLLPGWVTREQGAAQGAGTGPKQPECPQAFGARERRVWRQDSLSLVRLPIPVTPALPGPLLVSI